MDGYTFSQLRGAVLQQHERDLVTGKVMLEVLIGLGNYLRRMTKGAAEIGTMTRAGEFQKDEFNRQGRNLIPFWIRFFFNDVDGREILSRTFPLELSTENGNFLIERSEVDDDRERVVIPFNEVDTEQHMASVVDMLEDSLALAVQKYVN